MQTIETTTAGAADPRYARCIENSRRVRWDLAKDVVRGRELDFSGFFLPHGLSMVNRLGFLTVADARLLSHVQGRTYANMFGLVERFINAKILELSRDYVLADQVALEALVNFSQEELRHQEMFRYLEREIGARMPPGYRFLPQPNEVASAVLAASTWAVLALTSHIELFVHAHYVESIQSDSSLSPLFKDVFLHHWKDESQHVVLDELEWKKEDGRLTATERDFAVRDFITLVGAVDRILQSQADADASYFAQIAEARYGAAQIAEISALVLRAYRWQYILSGAGHPRFQKLLTSMITPAQAARVMAALAPIAG
ncbi:MAG TPA: hypothetical protein VLW85_23980 [Myxococcales bacterium]|nr:hypothetical protein [Myxococcales bacterium]